MIRKQKVFVVHGQDHKARNEITELLKGLGVQPLVLSKSIDYGETIIEKFEFYAEQCEFAIILLTPDDRNASRLRLSERYRARQNVIFEMGWFFARLGRKKTLLIYKGTLELPSDVTGILYKKFRKSPRELRIDIKGALLAGGVIIKGRR